MQQLRIEGWTGDTVCKKAQQLQEEGAEQIKRLKQTVVLIAERKHAEYDPVMYHVHMYNSNFPVS